MFSRHRQPILTHLDVKLFSTYDPMTKYRLEYIWLDGYMPRRWRAARTRDPEGGGYRFNGWRFERRSRRLCSSQ